MKVAVFLDVDGVLTETPINMQLAQMLGVDDRLAVIEDDFASARMTPQQFNKRFLPLLREAGLTQEFLARQFDTLSMSLNYEILLRTAPNVHLVSSGPSYFVDELARRYEIPPERVYCSQYTFTTSGILDKCIRPVSAVMKGEYVRTKVHQFDITIGVGDNPHLDLGFLSQCNIRILVGEHSYTEFLNVRELQPVLDIVQHLNDTAMKTALGAARFAEPVAKLRARSGKAKTVFIMTPFRQRRSHKDLIVAIKRELAAHGLKGWIASDVSVMEELWGNVQAFLLACDYGIAVFVKDGHIDATSAYSPNVAVELGYMYGRGKPVLLLKDRGIENLFTDITGFLHGDFDIEEGADTVAPPIRHWLESLGLAVPANASPHDSRPAKRSS